MAGDGPPSLSLFATTVGDMSSIPPVVGLVTFGVRDVAAATAFYVSLGFPLSSASGPAAAAPAGGGVPFRGVAVAVNVATREDVDAGLAAAVAAGGTIARA